jgi:hypothetical protein
LLVQFVCHPFAVNKKRRIACYSETRVTGLWTGFMWLMIVDLVKRSIEIQVPSKARNLLTTAGNVVFLRRTPLLSLSGTTAPSGPGPPHSRGFYITQRRTTVGRSPLDEGSARRRDLYLTTHNTHNRQGSMPLAAFELTIPTSNRP